MIDITIISYINNSSDNLEIHLDNLEKIYIDNSISTEIILLNDKSNNIIEKMITEWQKKKS